MNPIVLNYEPSPAAPRLRQPDWLVSAMAGPTEQLAYHLYAEGSHPGEEQGHAVAWMKAAGQVERLEECRFLATFGIGLGPRRSREIRLLSEIDGTRFRASMVKHLRWNQADPALPGWRVAVALAAMEVGRARLARAIYPEINEEFEWPMSEAPQAVYLVRSAQRQVILDGICSALMRPEVIAKEVIIKSMLAGFASTQMVANQAVAMAIGKSSIYDPVGMIDLLISLRERQIRVALKTSIELTLNEMQGVSAPIPSPVVTRLARLS